MLAQGGRVNPMTLDEVTDFLKQRNIQHQVKDIDHGKQVRTGSGETVNVYNTGKVVVGGKVSTLRDELKSFCDGKTLPAVPDVTASTPVAAPAGPSTNIFVVYGHDTGSRDALELLLRRFGMNPIVLANLPAAGDTVIEKLEKYMADSGNVGFACVLLTPDDEGNAVAAPEEKKYRARQNVILELGMVLAKLQRRRVAILYKESVERPSDIEGLLYLPFKEHVSEAANLLFRELTEAGYKPDPTAL